MADVENVVVVRFTEPSKAYQALTVLKECDAEGRIALQSAAIAERTADMRHVALSGFRRRARGCRSPQSMDEGVRRDALTPSEQK